MEPLFANGGLVVADLAKNRTENLKEGGVVKYLRWVEKGKLLSIESENKLYAPVFRKVREVTLIGQVIWSCREHK
jgi:phage repressor protein C with HTH and peptisase S24 domain